MSELSLQATAGSLSAEAVNARYWPGPRLARKRARRSLRPAEAGLLERYGEQLSGDVLELAATGCVLTSRLNRQARTLTAFGISTPTVELCRKLHPTGTFLERDLRDLDSFDEGSFNAVVAGRCAIDRFGDGQRRRLLDRINRVLADDGLLIFSSHNLACESLVRTPGRHLFSDPFRLPARLARFPRAVVNRVHLSSLQQREHGYAVLNNPARNFSLLSYYVSRDSQERQLIEHGFELIECVTLGDEPVLSGDDAFGCHELYYAARPVARLADDDSSDGAGFSTGLI